MTSEVENISNGKVIKSIDFDINKKIIGVSNSNLTPNEQGVSPLGKQGAFEVEKKETIENFDIGSNPVSSVPTESLEKIETFDLPSHIVPEGANKFVPESVIPEIVTESPVEVVTPEKLNTFIPPQDEPKETIINEVKPVEEPAKLDIQMPVMPETIVAEAPSGQNDNLFINPEYTNNTIEPQVEEQKLPELPENTPAVAPVIDIDEIITQKMNDLINTFSEFSKNEIGRVSEEIKTILEEQKKEINAKPIDKVEHQENDSKALVDEALNQINNMIIPGQQVQENPNSISI